MVQPCSDHLPSVMSGQKGPIEEGPHCPVLLTHKIARIAPRFSRNGVSIHRDS